MSPRLEPEFAEAFSPAATQWAKAPKARPGNVEDCTNGIGAFYQFIVGQLSDYPNVSHNVHHCSAKDDHIVSIYHFYRKDQTEKPAKKTSAIIFFHGGGFLSGCPFLQRRMIEARVESTGVPFFAVDYRIAPQHQYPKPLEDSYTALVWLHEHADKFNIDTKRIGVYGESAGGNLAASVALMARDNKISPPLAKQILIYPMIDDETTVAPASYEPSFFWSYDNNSTAWKAYLGTQFGTDSVSQYAAPARAASLCGLPSTYIDVGSLDIFVHESLEYAQRLCRESVEVEMHIWPSLPHCFDGLAPQIKHSKKALEYRDEAVKSI